jgi:hypothetical protein
MLEMKKMEHLISRMMTLQLKYQFPFLSFFSDAEVRNLLTVVRSVSLGLKVKPEVILFEMSRRWSEQTGTC